MSLKLFIIIIYIRIYNILVIYGYMIYDILVRKFGGIFQFYF